MADHALDLGIPSVRRSGVAVRDLALAAFTIALAGTALAAYNLGPVPVQWLAQLFAVGVVALLGLRHLYAVPSFGLFGCVVVWALVVTLANAMFGDYASKMAVLATAPYPVFLVLRFLGLFAFAASVFLVYWLLREGYRDRVMTSVVVGGSLVAGVAIYIYLAQLYGLWEPIRSRMGTAGGEQATLFTYAFHRAIGTFREPSHLAEWLVVPLFLSLGHPGRLRYLHVLVIGTALLLTGSLTGLIGMFAGLTGAVLLTNPLRGAGIKVLVQVGVVLALAVVVFSRLAVSYAGGGAELLKVLEDRIVPIVSGGGMAASNRGYVFEYLASQPMPIVGAGLGNANLAFTEYLGNPVVASFVSLYSNYLMSLGIVGLVLLLTFLARPVVQAVRLPAARKDARLLVILAGYLAWLLMFAVQSEELQFMFGVVFALLVYEVRERSGAAGREV